MSRLALLCPGQGSQRPGMLASWIMADGVPRPDLVPHLEAMAGAAGMDLAYLGTQAEAEEIRPTEVAQPLTLATSLLAALAAGLIEVDDAGLVAPPSQSSARVVAGHSLGYLTALALAGLLTLPEASHLAAVRGRAMARCAVNHPGGMWALMGGERESVLEAISAAGLTAANINAASQVVASGPREALEELKAPAGVRVIPLAVAGAFHTEAMAGAAQEVAEAIAALPERRLRTDLIDDATGSLIPAGASGREALAAVAPKITAPVRWDLTMEALAAWQPDRGVELAPAGTLAGFARRDMPALGVAPLRALSHDSSQ